MEPRKAPARPVGGMAGTTGTVTLQNSVGPGPPARGGRQDDPGQTRPRYRLNAAPQAPAISRVPPEGELCPLTCPPAISAPGCAPGNRSAAPEAGSVAPPLDIGDRDGPGEECDRQLQPTVAGPCAFPRVTGDGAGADTPTSARKDSGAPAGPGGPSGSWVGRRCPPAAERAPAHAGSSLACPLAVTQADWRRAFLQRAPDRPAGSGKAHGRDDVPDVQERQQARRARRQPGARAGLLHHRNGNPPEIRTNEEKKT